jgi:hypothetical protein
MDKKICYIKEMKLLSLVVGTDFNHSPPPSCVRVQSNNLYPFGSFFWHIVVLLLSRWVTCLVSNFQ